MNKVVEIGNSPAMTLIFRAATAISIAVFAYFASSHLSHKDDHASSDLELAVSIERLSLTLERIEADTKDRYTSSDASRDQSAINARIDVHERRVAMLEARIRDMEMNR